MNDYELTKASEPVKKESIGHMIYNELSGLSAGEKRDALAEATERIHASYKQRIEEIEHELKCVHSEWDTFKNGEHAAKR